MDLVNFRNSLTSPPMAAAIITPPGPSPGAFTVTQSSPFSLDSSTSSSNLHPYHHGNGNNGTPASSQAPAAARMREGGSPLSVLVGMNSTLANSAPQVLGTGASEDEESYLLKLVDEVTKDEEFPPFGLDSTSSLPMGNASFGGGGSISMLGGSVTGVQSSATMLLPGVANVGPYSVSPTLRGGSSGVRAGGGPPGYDEAAGGSTSFGGGSWSIGASERPEAMMLGQHVGGMPPPPQQQPPLFTSSPEPNSGLSLFPSSSQGSEAPKYGSTGGISGPAPPPPTGGAPPSFATAVASMHQVPLSPAITSATNPAPPPPPPQARMPETLIVRNEHGVFLLQPVGSTSPMTGPAPHGNTLSPVPSSHGMSSSLPAPPPPAPRGLAGSGQGSSSQQGMGGSLTSAPPAYGAPRKGGAPGTPTPGAAAPPPPPPAQGHHPHNGVGGSPMPGSANSSFRGQSIGGSARGGLPGYGAAPAYGSESPQGPGPACPPPYGLPPPGSAPLVSGGSPQAASVNSLGNGSMLSMDALPPPFSPSQPPGQAQAPGGAAPPPPPYGGPKGGR